MDAYRISEVAERTGFSASTLRFYEQSGIVRPARTAAGYRTYDDADLATLGFVARAKRVGLRLDEITELLSLIDGNECEPVQVRLQGLVDAKLAEAHEQQAELAAFTAQLHRLDVALSTGRPDGPCDVTCGCTLPPDALELAPDADVVGSIRATTAAATTVAVALGPRAGDDADVPIACSLEPDRALDQLAAWHALAATAATNEPTAAGRRLVFDAPADLVAITGLVAAEADCCGFLAFTLAVSGGRAVLDIAGPADARPAIELLAVAS